MELRTYLNSIFRYWWLVLLLLVVGGVLAAGLDRIKKPVYSSEARVAVRPSPTLSDTRTIIDLVGQMGARYIAGTYAQTFTSAQVRDVAQKAVGLSADDAGDYALQANVLPDTAVIAVEGTGPDPTILVNYINATLEATVHDTGDLFRVMDLVPLEQARVPSTPDSPQPSRDIPAGAGLGLGVGIVLALLLDLIRGPRSSRSVARSLAPPVEVDVPVGSRRG
jgi:succinoglycan biosynthesis transport protein ExoP